MLPNYWPAFAQFVANSGQHFDQRNHRANRAFAVRSNSVGGRAGCEFERRGVPQARRRVPSLAIRPTPSRKIRLSNRRRPRRPLSLQLSQLPPRSSRHAACETQRCSIAIRAGLPTRLRTMPTHNLLLLAGDGIGPEVMAEVKGLI